MAFRNTDGSYVLVIHNTNDTEIKPTIKIGDHTVSLSVKPQSFNTITLNCD
ncbi:MAG: hypothetical protein LBK45_04320 [Tannerellaceae bacterium]|nr:hypothetical protein [Tannerellaceae bacterium]